MKIIKSTSFRSFTTASKIDGKPYIIPNGTSEGIQVSDEVAHGFEVEFLHEVSVSDIPEVEPQSPVESSAT